MRYENTFPTRAPRERLRALAERFADLNFRIEERNDCRLRLQGPGTMSTKQNPLLGITEAEIRLEGGAVYVDLEIVDIKRLFVRILLAVFVPLLLLALVVPWFFVAAPGQPPYSEVYLFTLALSLGGNLVIWMILLPIISRYHSRRTVDAVETLFANLEKL